MENKLDIIQILFEASYIVQFVLLVLIFCSLLSWAIIFYKRKVYKKISKENEHFNALIGNSLSLSEISLKALELPNSTRAILFQKGYAEFQAIKEKFGDVKELKDYMIANGHNAILRSYSQAQCDINLNLEHKLSLLATIGSITPFIGLFGTVWGIINSFSALSSGAGSIEAIAPGIAEALVATAIGLAAAIPAVWAFNLFTNKNNEYNLDLESSSSEFLNLIERSLLG
jgi:biopolymer transport protein TolQ